MRARGAFGRSSRPACRERRHRPTRPRLWLPKHREFESRCPLIRCCRYGSLRCLGLEIPRPDENFLAACTTTGNARHLNQTLIILSFAAFLLAFTIIGALSSRRSTASPEDDLVASRSVNPWLVALSAVSTNNSGSMFIGLIGAVPKRARGN